VFPSTDIIVKASRSIKIWGRVKVMDKEMRQIGTIKEIFGPIKAPYISIRPSIKVDKELIGQPVYIAEKPQ